MAVRSRKTARKPGGDRKQNQIRVRVTEEEKERLTRAARVAGLGVSTWLRVVGLQAAERRPQDKR